MIRTRLPAHTTLADNVAAVEAERATWDADPPRVRSLARWHGIDAAVQNLPAAETRPAAQTA